MNPIRIQRIYSEPHRTSEYRVLVDRLWPRGISKDKADLDEWMKQIAPSAELRQSFHHDQIDFAAFTSAYRSELDTDAEKRTLMEKLRDLAKTQPVVLLYGARDPKRNHAIVLLDYLKTHYHVRTASTR